MKRVVLNYLVIAALAVPAAFTSCKKDMENVFTVKLLETITVCCRKSDGIDEDFRKYDKYKFEYDEQNRITKMSEYYYDGSLSYTNTFTYEGDDLVQVVNIFDGYVNTFEYTKSGNTINLKLTCYDIVSTYTIELNSDGLPVKRERAIAV